MGYGTLLVSVCWVAWLLMLLPSIVYLLARAGWQERRQRIFTYFTATDLKRYFRLYFPSVVITGDSDDALAERFKKHYGCYYGRRHFIFPLILLGVVSALAAWGVSETLQKWENVPDAKFALPTAAVAAVAGAYTWVMSDHLSRLRRRDFSSTDVYNGAFRFLVSVPFGFSLAALANKDFGVALAFLIGVFPTQTLFTIGRRLFSQKLGLGEDQEKGKSELEKLQNVGRTNAERFYDEGITTIAELAWTDPVDLAVRTNFQFNYVIDCMGQALLAVYIGDDIQKLGPFSLRAAQDAASLIYDCGADIDSTPTVEQKYARQALTEAANLLKMDTKTLYYTLTSVADDPYTEFIWRIWPQAN